MNRARRIRLSSLAALTMPVLWLMACGCTSIEKEAEERRAGGATAHVSSTKPMPVEIEDGHVRVRARVNGREMRLVLDTGASHVALSPQAAAAAGVKQTAKVRFGAFGSGRGTARLGVAEAVTVGPAHAEKIPTFIMPIPSVFDADGFVGLSFLRQFIFRLDYEHKLLSFAAPGSSNLAGAGSSAVMQVKGVLTVQAEVDGTPAELVVDTGAGQGLILRHWFVEEEKLRERYPKRLSLVTGGSLLGQMRGEIARLQTLKLGDYSLTNVFVEFESKSKSRHETIAGFIGAGLLRRFNLTFDLAGRRLWIEPNADYAIAPPPPASVRSGLVCLPEGTNWIVRDLIPGSPAAEAGVRLGDRLLKSTVSPFTR